MAVAQADHQPAKFNSPPNFSAIYSIVTCLPDKCNACHSHTYSTDGRPLVPVSNPVQTGETLTTITITWGESPVPSNSPVEGYTISLSPTEGSGRPLEVETADNETTIELFRLVPGGKYQIVVFGRNSNGAGPPSGSVVARTVVPQVPYSPSHIEGVLETSETNSSIKVTWTVRELFLLYDVYVLL